MLYLFAAPVLAVALMLILMPGCIKELRKLKFGQTMYELGPQTHLNKKGTPNMGGLVIGLVTVVVTVLFARAQLQPPCKERRRACPLVDAG